jgi:hypothetical protein
MTKKQSPSLDRLLKKAQPKAKKPNLQNSKGVSRFNPNQDPDRYEVFQKLFLSSGNHAAAALILFIVLVSLGFSYGWDSVLPLLAFAVGLWLAWKLFMYIYYQLFFREWRKKLLFQLEGWERLVNRDILRCDLCWSTVTIEVKVEDRQSAKNYTKAALKLFGTRAEKKFYTRDTDADDAPTFDPRNSWKFIDENKAGSVVMQGSASTEVIALIKKLILGDLSMINRESPGAIKTVILSITDQYQEVDIEVPSTVGST